MYSRRFYSSQRAKNTPVIQTVTPKKAPSITVESQTSDTRPRWATDFFEDQFWPEEKFYVEPRDFAPAVTVVNEEKADLGLVEAPASADVIEDTACDLSDDTVTEDIGEKMKNMTFEDMMLTWLAMLGSSGEYDDEIFIILGLILMIGA